MRYMYIHQFHMIFWLGKIDIDMDINILSRKCSQSLQTISGLAGILLSIFLSHWDVRCLGIAGGNLLRLPDKVLEEFAIVFGEQEFLRLVNDITEILDKDSAFLRKLL